MSIDTSLFRAVNRLADRTPWAHGAVAAFARFGIVTFAALLMAGWWAARRRGDLDSMAAVMWAGGGSVAAVGLNQVLGRMFHRVRPYAGLAHVHVLISRTTDFSFPSDHAVAAGAVATGLLLARRRLGACAVVLALLMAAARVYAGVHYPADVVAGLLVGGTVVAVGAIFAVPAAREVLLATCRSRWRTVVVAPGRGDTPEVPHRR